MAKQLHPTDSDTDETSDEEQWFQMKRPSLLKQLQNIMREYPDDVQILYELVQNAEDAKATKMKIMFDSRNIDPGGSYGKYLKSPALCVYNDAVFEKHDWDGIASVFLSHKENIAYKIGRYGQGFKSVFHITDFPVVISGHYVLLVDPFRDKECRKPKLIKFEREIVKSGILNLFGLSRDIIRKGHYNGTLFWFPLRTTVSKLSKNVYASSKIEDTLEMFKIDSHYVLLFLKYLKEIEVFSISGKLLNKTEVIFDETKTYDSLCRIWRKIESGTRDTHCIAYNCTTNTITNTSRQSKIPRLWTVVHFYAGDTEMGKSLASLARDTDIACLPYVGVAFQWDTESESGRVFNFLPLPATTNTKLPVHVNANFALSQNRRHLKLSDGKSSDKFVQWNEEVVSKLVPMAYVKLVEHLIEQSTKNRNPKNQLKMVYDCMPQHKISDSFWKLCVSGFYKLVIQLPVFFTERNKGKWVFKDSSILCDITTSDISTSQREDLKKTIKTVLFYLNKNAIDHHDNMRMLMKYVKIKEISPTTIIQYLKTSTNVIQQLTREQKIHMLHYIMTDPKVDIDGLELLPLQNGGFESFRISLCKEFIYVPASSIDSSIFPGLEHRFVSCDLPQTLMENLNATAKKGRFQLRILEYKNIPQLLDEVFRNHCHYTDNGKVISKQKSNPLDVQWMGKIWSVIVKTDHADEKDALHFFEKLPLIPQYLPNNSQIDSFHVLKGNYILTGCERKGLKNLPEWVLDILQSNEIRNLDWNKVIESSNIIGKYIKYPLYDSVIELCKDKPKAKRQIQSRAGFGRDLWLSQITTAISFGQKEDLVIRLKGILASYPRDHSILKEMIQNADDAGAKEMHIVHDMRNHSTNTVFENWKPLQGHALCVFNDAVFTDCDLKGIKRLGVGSKGADKTKTGQFGIGFNSVYHLTDAPCILALGPEAARAGCFCVLDPHCQYAPYAHDGDPGMCMKAVELKSKYPDVFNTFLSTTELKRNKGTWFRFPIRRSDHKKSQICNTVFSSTEIEYLLLKMKRDIQESLLFLLNIKHITISSINSDSLHTIHCSVKVSDVEDANRTKSEFKEHLEKVNTKMKSSPSCIFSTDIVEFKYLIDVKFHSKESSQWLIVQTLGFTDPKDIDQSLKESITRKEISFIPRGGVAFKVLPADHSTMTSKAFCLLPLPVETGLSCHVNGQFAIDMSRNKLWGSEESIKSDVRSIWNLELIRRCIAYAYAGGIAFLNDYVLEQELSITMKNCVDNFPLYSTAKNIFWKELVAYVFLYLKKRQLSVYPVKQIEKKEVNSFVNYFWKGQQFETIETIKLIRRHNPNETPILIDDLDYQNLNSSKVERLRGCFFTLGMTLITLPTNLKSGMQIACEHLNNCKGHNKDTCICIQNISPKAVIDFFKSRYSGFNVCYTNYKFKRVKQVKSCLEYCLKHSDLQEIIGLPLLLKNDEFIDTFQNQNQLILSKYVDLLPESSELFVHKSLVGIEKFQKISFKNLTMSTFAQLLPKSLDCKFRSKHVTIWTPKNTLLTREWLESFWEFVDETDECLDALEDWTLLPVTMSQAEYLLPLKYCNIVIDYDSFDKCPHSELCPILRKLQLPTPTLKSTVLDTLLVKYDNTCNILHSLCFWRKRLEKNLRNLTESERVSLISYLVIVLNSEENSNIAKLKALSVFMTIDDIVVSLQTSSFITIKEGSNTSMPGLENLCKELDITVLRYYNELWNFYKIINCKVINMGDLYAEYILPHFSKVDAAYHIFHLDYINMNLLENAYVISALKLVHFIRKGQVDHRADAFFNPDQPLFKILCNKRNFPPPPFDDVKWRKLLVSAGLVSRVSESTLLHFARIIEASLPTEDMYPKLKHFLQELYDFMAMEKKISPSFFKQLSLVRFLLVHRNESKYEEIHSSLNTSLRFVSFQESISNDQIDLVWTTADVLPRYAMHSDKNILKRLHVIEEPCFEDVMNHAKNICSVLYRSCADHDETFLTTIMRQIYSFLSRKDINVSELNGIPLIHILKHKKFAYPSGVVKLLSDGNEIYPYLLKASEEYGQFFKLFICLGMNDEPTVATYSKVLYKIHKNCCQSSLDPVELFMIQKALQGFMKSLQKLEEPVHDLEVKELYLMSTNNQFLPANQMYYESLEIRRQRLETEDNLHFLADFGCLSINVVELPRLFAMIPEDYRPLSVQSIVTEKLAFHELNESETALKLLEILRSEPFINALLRICKHDQKIMSNKLTVQDMQHISAKLRRLRIFSVSKLETKLQRGHIDIDGTKSNKSCFYDDEKEMIYIHDQCLDVDRWLCINGIELERILRRVCFGKFQSRSLLCIFSTVSSDLNRLQEGLTELGIASLEEDLTNLIWYPLPGSLVPKKVHPRLRKPLQSISVNHYAAIPCGTDKKDYGRNQDCEEIFMYVVVTNAAFSSLGTLQYYMVNVGKLQDIKIDKELILEIRPFGRHTEEDDEYECSSDESVVDEIDSRPLHNARECHVFRLPNQQKRIGGIWLAQARYDLKAGHATLHGIDFEPFKGYNWICIQCQQAAEKAVKAAQYATDANQVQRSHFYKDNIPKGDSCLSNLCWELSYLIGHVNALRYPDNYRLRPPADLINREHATKALLLTDQILTYVSKEYFI